MHNIMAQGLWQATISGGVGRPALLFWLGTLLSWSYIRGFHLYMEHLVFRLYGVLTHSAGWHVPYIILTLRAQSITTSSANVLRVSLIRQSRKALIASEFTMYRDRHERREDDVVNARVVWWW
jgi:hypothetical protein